MTELEALILGIVQGITEFIPVSSSGHLALGQYLFGLEHLDGYITFDLACHLGTLLAILLIYSSEIRAVLSSERTRFVQIVLGTLPLFPILLVLKPIESLYDQPELVGFFFLITAALLYLGIRLGKPKPNQIISKNRWRDPLIIGALQTLALLPGVSRSGATISAARLLGWEKQSAVTFSFLLAIPAILGGTALKTLQLIVKPTQVHAPIKLSIYLIGFASSAVVGYFALRLLITLAAKEKFMYFVWYCLILGLMTIGYFFH